MTRFDRRHQRERQGCWHRFFCCFIIFLVIVALELFWLDWTPYRDQNLRQFPSLQEVGEKHLDSKRDILVMIANYRDSKRCGETIRSIYENAIHPELIMIAVYDQIYSNEKSCVQEYCLLDSNCRLSQIRSTSIDASDAKGPTVARYMTEEMIENEYFCLSIDSHLVFMKNWDTKVVSQWDSLENDYAIITSYPKSTKSKNRISVPYMCKASIETDDQDCMIQYSAVIEDFPRIKPRLGSQLAGGFNFGTCKQAKEIRNDPYTPFLFHGEEYSRAARLWTHGYDMYCPSDDIVLHWYEKRNVVWERNWDQRWLVQQKSKRRIRFMLGLPVSRMDDIDFTDIKKYSLGTKRTFDQWIQFTNINPLAPYDGNKESQFDNCRELTYVPYVK